MFCDIFFISFESYLKEVSNEKLQKHKVELTPEERQTLQTLVRKGEHSALFMRAHILLKADSGPGWTDAQIADLRVP